MLVKMIRDMEVNQKVSFNFECGRGNFWGLNYVHKNRHRKLCFEI